MKKILRYTLLLFIVSIIIGAWLVFADATTFTEKGKYIFIRDGNIKEQVLTQLDTGNIIRFPAVFKLVAEQSKVWENLKPGRFEVKKGESIFNLVRALRNNTQSPVRLTINKLRLREDLARQIGKNFSIDSAKTIQFLTNIDSLLQLGVDSNTLFSIIIPDTYFIKWNTSLKNILNRFKDESEKFWNKNDRLHKAEKQGLTPLQVYILASIVEEETNKHEEKGNIASVYVNRLNKGMLLGADPTIKYALRNFSIARIYYGYLNIESPYNTYRYKGLPPGPVCTPSQATIDAVLDMPKTDYLFFVAKSDFSGYHHFSNNFAEHEQYAKQYQKALDSLIVKKQNL
jgi:UPF0755 protein